MTMLKIFEDRYINLRLIDQVFITSEKCVMGKMFYNVEIQLQDQKNQSNLWLGLFDTLEDAQEAVEEIFNDEEIIEFTPTYN